MNVNEEKTKHEYLPLKFEQASEMRISKHIFLRYYSDIKIQKGTNFSLTMLQFLFSETEYLICNIELRNYAARSVMFILKG